MTNEYLFLCRWPYFKLIRWRRSWGFPHRRLSLCFRFVKADPCLINIHYPSQETFTFPKKSSEKLFTTHHILSTFLFVCQHFWNPSFTQSFHVQFLMTNALYCADTTIRSFVYLANFYATIIVEQWRDSTSQSWDVHCACHHACFSDRLESGIPLFLFSSSPDGHMHFVTLT